ncbi:hypothetical protein BKA70DRAFT_1578023 [Coprinopsis sp. MPI-PUGE-AT-0042]|nr:hypothetical protein BKA70DRAFT_1578023 [Coprinopsis sp. MPI-PUGE-AT-0042]
MRSGMDAIVVVQGRPSRANPLASSLLVLMRYNFPSQKPTTMLSFNHPRPCPYIRLLRFTPNVLDTGAVKPFLRQLAEMNLTEARVAQGICIEFEISPRSQLPSPWSLHQRIDRALPTHASHAREHCHIKVANGPWSVDHFCPFRNHCEQSQPTWEKLNLSANIQAHARRTLSRHSLA